MPAPWTELPVLSLDCETTGTNVFEDRIVELGAATVERGEPTLVRMEVPGVGTVPGPPRYERIPVVTDSWSTIVDPGIEIAEESTGIHGITTERARAEGIDPAQALRQLALRVWEHIETHEAHAGIVIFNGRFDLPLLIAECARHGITWPPFAGILDPLVIDKACDHWRKDRVHHRPVAHTHRNFEQAREHRRGRRKLMILADRYGVELSEDDAHGALADATAAAWILWRLIERFPQVAEHSLSTLWLKQVQQAARQRDGLQDWIRQNRDPSCELVGGWPLPERAEKTTKPTPAPVPAGATA